MPSAKIRFQPRLRSALPAILLTLSLAALSGCSHRRVAAYTPPPPSTSSSTSQPAYNNFPPQPAYGNSAQPKPGAGLSADQEFVQTHRPIYTQTGVASWYGTVYNHHRAADGTVYDENGLSAAHRTLPLGSLVKVTNLRTGQSAVMRITDRGPFVPGRIIDLSEASAKAVGLYRAGIGRVRVSVYYAPEPLDYGGRWAVQIGAFHSKRAAVHLEHRLQRKYPAASVIEFRGPTGDWVRIRPDGGNRQIATQIARTVDPRQGTAFLVRLD